MKSNRDIREKIRKSQVCSWEVADKLGMHENTFYRLLRKELPESDKGRIKKALEELEAERNSETVGI